MFCNGADGERRSDTDDSSCRPGHPLLGGSGGRWMLLRAPEAPPHRGGRREPADDPVRFQGHSRLRLGNRIRQRQRHVVHRQEAQEGPHRVPVAAHPHAIRRVSLYQRHLQGEMLIVIK